MPVRIVVGINWGDEGKGKMVDYFARQADYVVRFQGGNNAGHTVENEFGNFKLHLIPSGIFYPNVTNILGPGTVVNLEAAVKEIEQLKGQGIRIDSTNLKISDRAVIVFPFHQLQDKYEEERLGQNQFGSTQQGIAPVYADRYLKYSIQIGALNFPEYLEEQVIRCLDLKNQVFAGVYHKPPVNPVEVLKWAQEYGDILKPHICNTTKLLQEATKGRKTIILEGQLGTLRDVFYGIYPFSTSSSTIAAYGATGAGYFAHEPAIVTGVVKAFSTCVGEGPFVTEIQGDLADEIRETSLEYGASTGRPRRIGHFDVVASRYGSEVNGASELALTKLDSLSGQKTLKICTHYRVDSQIIDYFPIVAGLIKAEPVYIEMPGWNADIRDIRKYSEFPEAAKDYVETIEHFVQCTIRYISVGPHRDSMIIR
jgi:adenylosuccinate synthase